MGRTPELRGRLSPRRRLVCSVVLCTYNGERHLQEQLDSLDRQIRPPDEIIIRDDSSTDSTWTILRDFQSTHQHTARLERTAQNEGFIRNFENAIGLAAGDIIFLCDQDDLWEPEKIAAFEQVFLDQPDVGLVFSDAELVDDLGRPLGMNAWSTSWVRFSPEKEPDWYRGGAFNRIWKANVVTGSTMAFRAELRRLVLPFPPGVGQWRLHDGWIALAVAAVANVVPLSHSFTKYRIHGSQTQGLELKPFTRFHTRRPEYVLSGQSARAHNEAGLRELLLRVRQYDQDFECKVDIAELERRLLHLQTRLSMRNKRITERLRSVLRELFDGAYSRYSSGWSSALIDVLSPWLPIK